MFRTRIQNKLYRTNKYQLGIIAALQGKPESKMVRMLREWNQSHAELKKNTFISIKRGNKDV